MNEDFSMQPDQIAVDIAILQTMAARLDDYLSRDRLYWPMVVKTPAGTYRPGMSIGSMLMRLARLRAQRDQLTPEQRAILEQVETEMQRARRWYPQAYRDHALRELTSLLDSWRWFLDECNERPEQCPENYPAEVRTRTNIQLLIDHLGEDEIPSQLLSQVQALDQRLRMRFQRGEFIWDPKLASVFPQDTYWWLYGRPAA